MAFFIGNIYSKSLLVDTQLNIILPQDGRRYIWRDNPKTLILLHGLSDNAAVWYRRTAIERYAEHYNLAVAMPEIQRAWYHDMQYGHKAFSYITEEIPALLPRLFKCSVKREDLIVAGLSMGGYGAMRCAFERPDVFGYCGSFSGAYNIKELFTMSTQTADVLEGFMEDIKAIFGENADIPVSSEIPIILEKAKGKKQLPKLYLMCGTDDFIYNQSVAVHQCLQKLEIDHIYEEYKGFHEWDIWDDAIERMLTLFLGEGRKDWE
jgi:S-formylglutathione hydrolase FrmB